MAEYSILIGISRDTLRFYHYDPAMADKYVPFGDEATMPLAIWFNGNDARIGTVALQESRRGTPNAFANLIDLMGEQEKFDYANEKHDYNKLVLYALRIGLRNFFNEVKLNTLGGLDQNMDMPLAVMFYSDVRLNESAVIMQQLRDNGFGNAMMVSTDELALKAFCSQADGRDFTFVMSSAGTGLNISLFKHSSLVKQVEIAGANIDPRIHRLMQTIWDRTQAQYAFLEFSEEQERLEQAALKFLNSGKASVTEQLMLSDGGLYSYYLEKSDLRVFDKSRGETLLRRMVEMLQDQGARKEHVSVVLLNRAADNGYLYDLLVPEFPRVVRAVGQERAELTGVVLDIVKQHRFKLPKKASPMAPPSASPAPAKDPSTAPASPAPAKAPSTAPARPAPAKDPSTAPAGQAPSERAAAPEEQRSFRQLKAEVNALVANKQKLAALDAIRKFEEQMRASGITDFDADLDALRHKVFGLSAPEKAEEKPKAPPTPDDERLFRMVKASVRAKVANGQMAAAKKELDDFLGPLHARGVHDFDEKAAQLLQPKTLPPTPGGERVALGISPSDAQDFKIFEKTMERCFALGNMTEARKEVRAFEAKMRERQVVAYDKQISEYKQKIQGFRTRR